jgi:hypothetical protein
MRNLNQRGKPANLEDQTKNKRGGAPCDFEENEYVLLRVSGRIETITERIEGGSKSIKQRG